MDKIAPGTLIPLWFETVPPLITSQTISVSSIALIVSSIKPSSIRMLLPTSTSFFRFLYVMVARSAVPMISSVVSRNVAPASKKAFPPSKSRSRISGPLVSCIIARGRPSSLAAFFARLIFISCSAWSPCEKLKRATFIPARSSSFNFSSVCDTGPIVQTIFVFLM